MIDEALVELLDDKARDFEKLMARCEPRRCAIYEYRGLMFSETMEVADMVMTGRHRRVPVARGHLGGALYRSRTIFGAETIEVRDADASAFGGIFGIREYPAQTTPCQFETLLSVDFGFVLTQSFTFLGRAAATEKFRLRMTQMENAGDRAVSQADALIDAGDDARSFFKEQLAKPGLNLSIGCRTALADFAGGSDNSFADIKKTITNVLGLWLNPLVDAATSASDFDLRNLRKRPMSIYLGVSPDELDRIAPLYNLLFQQLIDLNVRKLPDENSPVAVLVILDEFSRLGRASVIASAFS